VPCDAPDADPLRTVCAYLDALQRWGYAVDSVRGDSVFTTLREANDFYSHPGGDFGSAYATFKRWVLDTMRVRDGELVADGGLRFTGKSAGPMREWLERWSSSHPDSRSRD
jgi:hypothetical protein